MLVRERVEGGSSLPPSIEGTEAVIGEILKNFPNVKFLKNDGGLQLEEYEAFQSYSALIVHLSILKSRLLKENTKS